VRPLPSRLVLLGHPVAHSLSPQIQAAAIRAAGLALTYEAMDVAAPALARVLERLVQEHAAGNVTVPHKERTLASCGRLSSVARRAGAVNTFWVEDGTLVGDNTDVAGFCNAVVALRGAQPSGVTIALLGAGGAAAGVLTAIAEWPGCRTRLWNRTVERAEALAHRFAATAVVPSIAAAVGDADLVINATSVGMRDDAMPVDPGALQKGADVIDLVYRPGETAWVRALRANGHRACDGLSMLVEQGALAFERWTGRAADRNVMWDAANRAPNR
jgi:shikimate dehydrogenase